LARRYVARFPHEPVAWMLLAGQLHRAKRMDEAIEVLRDASDRLPSRSIDVEATLGIYLREQGQFDDAWDLALEIDRGWPTSAKGPVLALQICAMGGAPPEESVAWSAEVRRRLRDEDIEIELMLVSSELLIAGYLDRAISDIRRMIERAPATSRERTGALLMLGCLFERLDEPEAAELLMRARKGWRVPKPFDRALEEQRATMRHPAWADVIARRHDPIPERDEAGPNRAGPASW
jgi:tetratricopeptide (TPR) repeat protein